MLLFSLLLSQVLSTAQANERVAWMLEEQVEMSAELRLAEHARLSGELRSLSRRSAWAGVDRTYAILRSLNLELDWEDHLMGAEASSELGHLSDTHERLYAAVQMNPEPQIVDWLWTIDQNFGRALLSSEPGAILEAVQIPLDPIERKAVDYAIASCLQTGGFDGLLPEGIYTFEGRTLQVEIGQEIVVDLSGENRHRYRSVRRR